jgi:GntR family transcriptional regulator
MMEIQENILSGNWSLGFQIPGEMELAHRLGVSVITIRQALGQLVREGYVKRERAKGTFVSWKGPLRQSVNLEVEAEDLVTVNRVGASFKLIAMEHISSGEEMEQKFGADEKVTRFVRIRMSQGQPLAHVVSYVPFRVGCKIREKDLTRLPLPNIIEKLSPTRITEVKHAVRARLSDDEVSAHLGIPAGSPVLLVERDYLCKKETVIRSVGFYRSDLFSYELKLKRRRSWLDHQVNGG